LNILHHNFFLDFFSDYLPGHVLVDIPEALSFTTNAKAMNVYG